MKKLNIVVVIVSDTRTDETDKSGKKLKHLIENDGHIVLDKTIVKDNIYEIRKVVSDNILNNKLISDMTKTDKSAFISTEYLL